MRTCVNEDIFVWHLICLGQMTYREEIIFPQDSVGIALLVLVWHPFENSEDVLILGLWKCFLFFCNLFPVFWNFMRMLLYTLIKKIFLDTYCIFYMYKILYLNSENFAWIISLMITYLLAVKAKSQSSKWQKSIFLGFVAQQAKLMRSTPRPHVRLPVAVLCSVLLSAAPLGTWAGDGCTSGRSGWRPCQLLQVRGERTCWWEIRLFPAYSFGFPPSVTLPDVQIYL